MKNINQPIREKLVAYRNLYSVKGITTSKTQFEANSRAEYVHVFLNSIIKNMDEQYSLIGKKVVKYKSSISFSTLEDYNKIPFHKGMNKTTDEEIEMTHEMYLEYEKWHINYLVGYISEDLLERQIAMYSTCQLSNLIHGWILEEKQKLIKYFKSVIN